MQREQFQSNRESELRVWLIDQKPKNLSEAARLADQYIAIRKADRPVLKGHDANTKGRAFKPRSFGESGSDRSSAEFQNAVSYNRPAKAHNDHKSSVAPSSPKFNRSGADRSRVICLFSVGLKDSSWDLCSIILCALSVIVSLIVIAVQYSPRLSRVFGWQHL